MLTRLSHQRAELVGFAQLPQHPEVEHRHRDDRNDVHEDGEEHDAVDDGVDLVPIERRLAEAPRAELVLEEPRHGEGGGQHDDDRHVLVGALRRADALGIERATHGDIAVDGEQGRQPVVRQADEVDERVCADEDVRIRGDVAVQIFGVGVHCEHVAEERGDQHEDVDDGQPLQKQRRRQLRFLVAKDDEGDGVGDDAEDDDRYRHRHVGDEPEQ